MGLLCLMVLCGLFCAGLRAHPLPTVDTVAIILCCSRSGGFVCFFSFPAVSQFRGVNAGKEKKQQIHHFSFELKETREREQRKMIVTAKGHSTYSSPQLAMDARATRRSINATRNDATFGLHWFAFRSMVCICDKQRNSLHAWT